MIRMKKVITMILSNGFISDPRVYKEAKYLTRIGYDVRVLCWDREGNVKINDEINGIKVYRLRHISEYGSGVSKQLWAYFKFLRDAKKFIKKNPTDYIHFHDLDTAVLSLFIPKRSLQFVLDMHEQYDRIYKGWKRKIVKLLLSLVSVRMDKYIVVNDIQISDYKHLYKLKPVYILRNLPEAEVFKNVKNNKCEKIRISFIGAVRDERSLATLIMAFEKEKLFQINIIGSGIAQERLYKKYKHLKHVKFVNNFKYEDILKFYNLSDIIYAAYDPNNGNYGMAIPVKVFEALFCELPVIVSKKTEVEKFVKDLDFGISVEYADPKSLKSGILKMLDNNRKEWVRFSLNAKKQKQYFTWENEVIVLNKIYNQQITI
jgi:glycosyltransferase involved in cell wall biosynthesis